MELPEILAEAAKHYDVLRRAAEAGGVIVDVEEKSQDGLKEKIPSVPLMVVENGCGGPCIDFRQISSEFAATTNDADLVYYEINEERKKTRNNDVAICKVEQLCPFPYDLDHPTRVEAISKCKDCLVPRRANEHGST